MAKKPAAKKSPVKKPGRTLKKVAAKKVAKKAPVKKVVKKAPAKKVVKKAPAKKVVKKAPVKKVAKKVAKKAPVKKVVKKVVKKTVAKKVLKVAATKSPKNKTTVKKTLKVQSPKKPTVAKAALEKAVDKKVAKKSAVKAVAVKKGVMKRAVEGNVDGKAVKKGKKVLMKSRVKPSVDGEKQRKRVKSPYKSPFLKHQRQVLLDLHDSLIDSMGGLAKDNLRGDRNDSASSAFGMHQADAGSDAYDRDFALSLLSQEQDALYEIEEALKRLDDGYYGVCEMSQQAIPVERLEAIPFARYTVDCQEQIERENRANGYHRGARPIFVGIGAEDSGDSSLDDD